MRFSCFVRASYWVAPFLQAPRIVTRQATIPVNPNLNLNAEGASTPPPPPTLSSPPNRPSSSYGRPPSPASSIQLENEGITVFAATDRGYTAAEEIHKSDYLLLTDDKDLGKLINSHFHVVRKGPNEDLPLQHSEGDEELVSSVDNSNTMALPDGWNFREADSFLGYQRYLLSPFFDMKSPHFVSLHAIESSCALPFIEEFRGERRLEGYHGSVWKVRIYPAHHNFPDGRNPYFAVKQLASPHNQGVKFEQEVGAWAKSAGVAGHHHIIRLLATCQSGSIIFRACDLWALGCVYLEFMVWCLQGYDAELKFSQERADQDSSYPVCHDKFFLVVQTVDQIHSPAAIVKPCVMERIHTLSSHPECSQLCHELLDAIEKDLLAVDPKK
ncbi:hypothetical protein MFIFM68171_09449 [Madurella fahalii]|uniref:Protein kinase domain-containing protein n=1 Tax=Madurella fahalii TaxID=1157608 RepID=A0ABQ0GNC4_9PEZI